MRTLFFYSLILFFCVNCTTTATHLNTEVGTQTPKEQTPEQLERQKTLDFYKNLEDQVQDFKTIHFSGSLPMISVNNTVFQLEKPISDYVQNLAFYETDTFTELNTAQPPKNCQRLLLVQKDLKNRKREMAKLTEFVKKDIKFNKEFTTAGFGINVSLDKSLKVSSLFYIIPDQQKVDDKVLEYYITNYGYPKEVTVRNASKGYIWGLEYEKEKYFLIFVNVAASVTNEKTKIPPHTYIVAYRKNSSC